MLDDNNIELLTELRTKMSILFEPHYRGDNYHKISVREGTYIIHYPSLNICNDSIGRELLHLWVRDYIPILAERIFVMFSDRWLSEVLTLDYCYQSLINKIDHTLFYQEYLDRGYVSEKFVQTSIEALYAIPELEEIKTQYRHNFNPFVAISYIEALNSTLAHHATPPEDYSNLLMNIDASLYASTDMFWQGLKRVNVKSANSQKEVENLIMNWINALYEWESRKLNEHPWLVRLH